MAAVRAVVPRFLLFAAASSARTVSTHAGAVCRTRVYSLFSHSRVAHYRKEASPFLSSYGHRELSSISEEGRRWDDVHLKEFQTLLKEGDTYIIDVREPWELEQYGKFPESVNIPLGDVAEALEMSERDFELKFGRRRPSRDGDGIIIHCMGGIRSRRVLDTVHELGYSSARHYIGGWEEWSSEVLGKPIDLS